MKQIRRLPLPVVAALVVTAIAVFAYYVLYTDASAISPGGLNRSLASAIHHEKERRMKENEVYFSYQPEPGTSSSGNQTTIETEHEKVVFEKTDSINRLSLTEKQNNVQQSYLFMEHCPVNVRVLDSLFCAELAENGIIARTAVSYRDNIAQANRFSSSDSLFYTAATPTTPTTLGVRGEITLRGFARLAPSVVITKNSKGFASILVIWVAAMAFTTIYIRRKKRGSATVAVTETDTGQLNGKQRPITPHILLDADKYLIIYHQKEIRLTPQLMLLFVLLLDAPDHYARTDELIASLYGNANIEKSENRLAQTVKRLRERLNNVREIEIENIPGQGYRLTLKTGMSA